MISVSVTFIGLTKCKKMKRRLFYCNSHRWQVRQVSALGAFVESLSPNSLLPLQNPDFVSHWIAISSALFNFYILEETGHKPQLSYEPQNAKRGLPK